VGTALTAVTLNISSTSVFSDDITLSGDLDVSGLSAFGNNASVSVLFAAQVGHDFTDGSAFGIYGLRSSLTRSSTGTTAGFMRAMDALVSFAGSGASGIPNITGFYAFAQWNSALAGTGVTMYGVDVDLFMASTGNHDAGTGINLGVGGAGAGRITTLKGINIENLGAVAAAAGTIVGIDIAAQTVATTLIGIRNAAKQVYTPPAAQSITGVGVAFLPTARIHEFTSTGNYTLTVAPTIANGQDGEVVTLVNVGSNTVTIQDQGTLASSNLRLTATTVAIGPRDSVTLYYSTDVGDWVQIVVLTSVI
jgi:hypothetical protein